MAKPIVGLHHVTAIASDPQRNLDFYTEVLGLRFVKRTVNFDDPGTYHFYFGDDEGTPGTILTFFPWPRAMRGHAGVGETVRTAFSVPAESVGYWKRRLEEKGVLVDDSGDRFGEQVLTFADPDGMKVEIVGHEDAAPARAPRYADVPAEHAIRGFFGVTLLESELTATAKILNVMGFKEVASEGQRHRFAAEGQALGNHIDVVVDASAGYGRFGAGSVHHIAFRAADDASQREWREVIAEHLQVTPVLDRQYFHSIYFREPGGVLFELATDPPGFGIDETADRLGEELRLPPWLEASREIAEQRLPVLELKQSSAGVVA